MATKTSTQNLSSLIINKVDTKETFQSMLANNQVNANELYFVKGEEQGSGAFVIEFTTPDNIDNVTCNKTYSEIIEAIDNSQPIYACFGGEDNGDRFNAYQLNYRRDPMNNIIHFFTTVIDNNIGVMLEIIYNSNNSIDVNQEIMNNNQATLTIGSYTYNGTQNVTIPIYNGAYNWTSSTPGTQVQT